MSLSRPITALALVCAVGTAAACGDGGDNPGTGATVATVGPTTSTPTPTPTPTPSEPTPTHDEGGDGDAEGDDQPATAGGGVCSDLSDLQVGDVLDVSVSGSGIPGGGCEFKQGGTRGTTVTIRDRSVAEAGGLDGAKAEATSTVEGEPVDVAGLGSAAFVVTGTVFGGTDVQGAGAVQVDNRIISVFLVQRSGLPKEKVQSLETDLLELVEQARG